MVAYGLLPQNVRSWWGPANDTLSFDECRFRDGNTNRSMSQSEPLYIVHITYRQRTMLTVQVVLSTKIV